MAANVPGRAMSLVTPPVTPPVAHIPTHIAFTNEDQMWLTSVGFISNNPYVVCNGFKATVACIESGTRQILLIGPSGVGKTFSLSALYQYYTKLAPVKRHVVAITASTINELHIQMKCAPADVWNNPVAKCTEELLLLVDLGRISHGVQEFYNTQSHMLMFRHCSQHIMVVAHSSGKGVYFDRSTLQSAVFSNSLNSLLKFHCITFYPFNDEEVTVFFEHYGTPQVEMEFIKSLTNYNPLLMESIVKKTSQLECIAAVGYVTNSYFLYISRRLLKPSYTFELSIKFLMQSQSNDKILTANEEAILQSSFLAQENLLYVNENNEISLNFPCLYHQLLDLLITSVKLPVSDMEARLVRSIRGYLFEVALSKKLFHNTLEIEYFKPAHQRKAEVSVHIASVEYLITDLYTIRESCLFMLKPSHEVIDAALLTPQHELLLIQISLVGYVRHESKAHHLRTRKIITGETILQYYKRISGIVDPDKVIYVYLTVSRNETVTKAKPERGAATDDNRFCVGVVKPKSQSSAMIDLSEGRISL